MVITEELIGRLLFPQIAGSMGPIVARGTRVSPGAASGPVIYKGREMQGDTTGVYVADRLDAQDLSLIGSGKVSGIVVREGDTTSHEIIIARASGLPVVSGVAVSSLSDLDVITIDATEGLVCEGPSVISAPDLSTLAVSSLRRELVSSSRIAVRANADTPEQTRTARLLGAQGLGPVRTEYMFFSDERLPLMQRFVLFRDDSSLGDLAALQQADFTAIYREMQGQPVGIRLFDPPFNEFCPKNEGDARALAQRFGIPYATLSQRLNEIGESNPMLGKRGARLGILRPEVYKMQLYAAFEAAATLVKEGLDIQPDITVPFVGFPAEMKQIRKYIDEIATDVSRKFGVSLPYTVTAMIELPIACYQAYGIAKYVDGFSFGTNDLAQTMYGWSRTDMGATMQAYQEQGITRESPFVRLTQPLCQLMELGISRGKNSNPGLQVGVCGEQASDPISGQRALNIGVDYLSCSPYRVPFVLLGMQREAASEVV